MSFKTIRLQDVRRLLKNVEEYELGADAIQKLKWFQYGLEHGGNVSLTCRHFGISRSTLLRWIDRFDVSDLRTLEDQSRKPHTVRVPTTDARTLEIITEIRKKHPTIGKEAVQIMLQTMHGIVLSTSTVGRIIRRHTLFFADTTSHKNKRQKDSLEEDLTPSPKYISPVTLRDSGDLSDDALNFPVFGVTS